MRYSPLRLRQGHIAPWIFSAVLAACGGGGGSSAPDASGAQSAPAGSTVTANDSGAAPEIRDCPRFPPSAIFNTRIDDVARFPVHANSGAWITMVGADTPLMPN